jgi:cytoskeletal protein CcmA (bactofilin family)
MRPIPKSKTVLALAAGIAGALLAGAAPAGDLNIEGNLRVQGSLSVSGAVTGIVMPAGTNAAPDDAATRGFVEDAVAAGAASDHTHTVFTNDLHVAGRLAVGTNAPSAALHVAGSTRLEGAVWVEPQGDLSMGIYTNGPR